MMQSTTFSLNAHCRMLAMLVVAMVIGGSPAGAYPLDGFAATGIRRLAYLQLIGEGKIKGPVA